MAYTPKHKRTSGKLSATSAKKLFEAARYVQQAPRNKVSAGSSPVDYGGATALILTTSLPARVSALHPSSGSGKIQQFDGTVFSDTTTNTYTVFNMTDKTVAIGSLILCVPAYGHFFLDNAACANLS